MSYEDLLEHSVYIQTATSSQNAFGDWEYSYTSPAATTSCRFSPVTAEQIYLNPGKFDDVEYLCFLASGASVNMGDRLVANLSQDANTYLVKQLTRDSNYHHITLHLVRL